ncbi:hypothetical protein ACFL6F_02310 [Planctomycetota bacterium]
MNIRNFLIQSFLHLCILASAYAQFTGNFEIEKHFLEEENFLDWKAYQDTIPWRYAWYEAANGIKTSTGSLSMQRFYFHEEIRLEFDFSDHASFLYEQRKDEFYRDDPVYHEAEFRFGKKYYFSLIGFPFHEKRFSNFGIALSYGERSSLAYIRLSYLELHASFNDINKRDDKLTGEERYFNTPVMYRFETKYLIKDKVLIECDLKYETHIGLSVPDEDTEKNYKGFDYLARVDWNINDKWLAGISFRTTQEKRWHDSTVSSDYIDQIMKLDGLDIYGGVKLTPKDHLTFGFLNSYFGNTIESNSTSELYDFSMKCPQVYCIWLNTRSERRKMFYSLQAGRYELYKEKKGVLNTDDDGIDIKAGVGIIMYEDGRYRFLALSTWDLDLFKERQWDGGNIQLQIYF